jgi:signal transduction histidine kinase/CheY-like chemotaxis protein
MLRFDRSSLVITGLAMATLVLPGRGVAQTTARDLQLDRLVSARYVQTEKGVPLTGDWRMQIGDNASWSLPSYADGDWPTLDPGKPLPDSIKARIREMEKAGHPAIAWFRVHLTPERLLIRRPLALAFANIGAADVFLDGRRILALGDVDGLGSSADVRVAHLPAPILFDSASAVLAVRINLGSALAHSHRTASPGLFSATVMDGAAIARTADFMRLASSIMMALCGVFLAVGVLHFVLYMLLRFPVSNLHYAGFAGQFAIFPMMTYAAMATESLQRQTTYGVIGNLAMSLSLLALLTFFYTSFNDRLPRYYRFVLGIGVVFIALTSGLLPSSRPLLVAFGVMLVVYVVECTRVVGTALLQKKNGARPIAIGAGMTLLFFIYHVLSSFGVVSADNQQVALLTWLSWLGLAFAPSIHIAYEFAATTQGFKALSGQLEHQVAVRTAELEEARIAAESANRTKSQFLANMSHELRTPLNAVIGYSEMLMEEAEDAGHDDYVPDLKKIHGSGRHLLGLINDILDLSKIEAGRTEMYYETFELAPMVEEVAATIEPLIARNSNTLSVDVAANAGTVRLDQVKVRQILFNLLSNASKFTENGAIELRVTRDDDAIAITVQDTGIGMTAEQLNRVFDPFIQADASTSKKYGGTGLGLTISQKFSEAMGGRIEVQSDPGKGTLFTVRLPADADAYSAAMAEPASEHSPAIGSYTSGTVLVIDDDATAREMLMRMLTKEGYRVILASSGDEGLRIAREQAPNVITLDVLMAGLDGWGVLSRLKADVATADIPVLVVTVIDDRNLGFALGAADYLTKPVDRERLSDALRRVRADGSVGPVLIVDDDAATREMLRRILEKDGWETIEAENGKVALDTMSSHTPAVILLDLMMPEMDGFSFIEEARSRGNVLAPIIVLTAKTLTETDRQRLNGAVAQVLSKGSHSSAELVAEIHRAIHTHSPSIAGGA